MNINIINLSKSFNRSQSSNHPISCLDWNPILYKLDEGVQGFAAKRITSIITNQSICLWCFWKTCTKVDMILTRLWICISNQKCNLILDFHAIWFEHAVFFSVGLPRLWKVLLPKPELGGEVGKVAFTTTASHRSTDRLELVRTPRQLWSSKLSGHCSLAMLNIKQRCPKSDTQRYAKHMLLHKQTKTLWEYT